MVYNPNANWTAKTADRQKAPSYYIAIDGLAATHYSTAAVRSAGTTKKALLRVPGALGQKIDELQGRQTMTLMTLELVDAAGEITDLIATEKAAPTLSTLVNRKVTVYSGDLTLAEADFAPILIARISDVKLTERGNVYKISLRDLKRAQQEDICENAEASGTVPVNTFFKVAASVDDTTIVVDTTENMSAGDMLYLTKPASDVEEKVEVVKVQSINNVVVSAGPRLGLQNAYGVDDEVRWATSVIEGNPVDIVYAVWTGDFGTTSSPGSASFPLRKIRGEPTGLGIAAADIDTARMIKERDRIKPNDIETFELKDPASGFRFLEQRIYKHIGYPIITGAGKLSLRLHRPAFGDDDAAGLPTLSEGDIRKWEWRRPHRLHINKVSIGLDLDLETGEPSETIVVEDTADQTATDEVGEIEVLKSGLQAADSGERIAEARGANILRRLLTPPDQLVADTDLTKRNLEAGDVLEVTHSKVPNIRTGLRGLTDEKMEVVEISVDGIAERVKLVLQYSPYTRPAFTGPAGALPTYSTATDAQKKQFAFTGPAGTPVPNFGDGTAPYETI